MNLHKWNKYLLISLLLVGLAIYAPGSPSQPDIRSLYFEVISTQDKLPNSVIRCIDQDSIGFLWFGSNDGLLHFVNEYRDKIHRLKYDPGHPESPSHQKVWGITQARDGNLRLGTDGGGIDVWNPRQGILKRIKHKANNSGLSDNAILCALTGSDGKLWFGTYRGGINRIDPAIGKIKVYNKIPAYAKNDYVYDIRTIYEDSKEQIWVGTNWKGVWRYDRENDRFLNVGELGSLDVRSIIESKKRGYWFGTHSRGLTWFDPLTKSRKSFTNIPGNSNSLPSNDVYFLKEDKDGKLWIGTQYGGLSCLDLSTSKYWKPGSNRLSGTGSVCQIILRKGKFSHKRKSYPTNC